MDSPPTYDGRDGGLAPAPPGYDQALDQIRQEEELARKKRQEELAREKAERAAVRQEEIAKMSSLEQWLHEKKETGHKKQVSHNRMLDLLGSGHEGPVIDDLFGPPDSRRREHAHHEARERRRYLDNLGINSPPRPPKQEQSADDLIPTATLEEMEAYWPFSP